MLKFLALFIIMTTGSLQQSKAIMGPITSGGGMVITCGDGAEKTYEVLDYYDARKKYGAENLLNTTHDLYTDFFNFTYLFYKLQGVHAEKGKINKEIKENFQDLISEIKWVNSTDLAFSRDQGPTSEPTGCKLLQTAVFTKTPNKVNPEVRIAQDIWAKLPPLQQAILLHHELWHINQRRTLESNSVTTRSYIGLILSADIQTPVKANLENATLDCFSKTEEKPAYLANRFYFHIIETEQGSDLHFRIFNSNVMITKTVASLNFSIANTNNKEIESNSLSFPTVIGIDQSEITHIKTKLRNDWSVEIDFKWGEPLSLQAYRGGFPIGPKEAIHCRKKK